MLRAVVSSFTICTGWPVCNTTMCGANRHPFCTNCTGWLGVEDSSGAPAEMYTTTFSSTFPCPTTRSSLFGGVEYIFAQPGSDAMLIVLAMTVTPSTVTLPPTVPPPCAPEAIFRQSVNSITKNNTRCVFIRIISYPKMISRLSLRGHQLASSEDPGQAKKLKNALLDRKADASEQERARHHRKHND